MMKIKPSVKLALALGVLVLAGLACSLGSGEDTPEATEVPSEPGVLFRDDFSNPSSGWENIQDAEGMTTYSDGGYRIQVLKDNFDYWANPKLSFTDTKVEVKATKLAGPDENDFGILCRYTDDSNFYFFLAGNDGYYAVGKVKAGEQLLIGMEAFEPSGEIRTGDGAVNTLRADCVGNQLSFYVNGAFLITVEDSDFTTGDVGLIAGTFDEAGTDVLFDDFVVRQP